MVWTRYAPPIHVAASLNALAAEFDALYPDRSKASDGALGNASHAGRASDHNPCYTCTGSNHGIIRAVDLTTTSWGVAGTHTTGEQRAWHQHLIADLIATERANRINRAWYFIHWIPGDPHPKMWSRTTSWNPTRYTGPSPHDHHFHTSIMRTTAAAADKAPWFTALHPTPDPTPTPTPTPEPKPYTEGWEPPKPWVFFLDKQDIGVKDSTSVWLIQEALGRKPYDGAYTVPLRDAVQVWQRDVAKDNPKLCDGILGPRDAALLLGPHVTIKASSA